MLELFWGILRNGKTLTGAILSLISYWGGVLTTEDLATLGALLAQLNAGGNVIMTIGVAHKVIKLIREVQARRQAVQAR